MLGNPLASLTGRLGPAARAECCAGSSCTRKARCFSWWVFWDCLFQIHSKSRSPKGSFSLIDEAVCSWLFLKICSFWGSWDSGNCWAIHLSPGGMQDGGKLPPPWRSSSWRLVITCPARAKRWQKDSMLQLSWRRWSWFQPGSSPPLLLGLLLLMEKQYVSINFIDSTKAARQILLGKLQGVASLLKNIWLTKSVLRSIGDFLISLQTNFLVF